MAVNIISRAIASLVVFGVIVSFTGCTSMSGAGRSEYDETEEYNQAMEHPGKEGAANGRESVQSVFAYRDAAWTAGDGKA